MNKPMTTQEAVDYTLRRKELAGSTKPNTSTKACVALLEELEKATNFINVLNPQLKFLNTFGKLVTTLRETDLEANKEGLAFITMLENKTRETLQLEYDTTVTDTTNDG
jgi:hypothetical protein